MSYEQLQTIAIVAIFGGVVGLHAELQSIRKAIVALRYSEEEIMALKREELEGELAIRALKERQRADARNARFDALRAVLRDFKNAFIPGRLN